jgi:quercetin dioxygenase-like cupin family protein
MSSVDRTLEGPVLVHRLGKDEQTIDRELVRKHGRSARTLVKEGPLRLTLMAVAPHGTIPPHTADGPVSIQVVEGDVTFAAAGETHRLTAGEVIVFAASVEHSATSDAGCVLLLTVVHLG